MEQKNIKIGIMGNIGSFSEEAGKSYCSDKKIANYTLEYLINAENVLAALEEGKIDLGVLGITNSISGIVMTTIEAMGKHNFKVKDVLQISIQQNLLVKKSVISKDITTIVSQLPALEQCKTYLKNNYSEVELLEYEDTAQAAKDLSEGTLPPTYAAIANRSCAKLYGLELLDENIQDNKMNKTTFIVVSK